MSFRFLPVIVYIAIAIPLITSVLLFIYSVKYFITESKILSMGFMLFSISSLIMTLDIIIEVYFMNYQYLHNILVILACIFFLIGFVLLMIVAWQRNKNDRYMRKLLITSWILFAVVFFACAIVILVVG